MNGERRHRRTLRDLGELPDRRVKKISDSVSGMFEGVGPEAVGGVIGLFQTHGFSQDELLDGATEMGLNQYMAEEVVGEVEIMLMTWLSNR